KVLTEANADPDNNDLVAEFTYRMRHKNGNWRWFHTYGTVFDRNADGKVEHVLNISLDVTEQFEAAEKIKEQEHFIQAYVQHVFHFSIGISVEHSSVRMEPTP